jgi:class 3 adenylate cyclase
LSRLEPVDKALLGILLPIWIACFTLHAREVVRTGYVVPPVMASPQRGDDYPHVAGTMPPPDGWVAQPVLETGDRLLRVGEVDLRGVGYFGFNAAMLEQAGPDLNVPVELERGGERMTLEVPLSHSPIPGARIPGLVAFITTVVLVLLRAPQRSQARRFFVTFMIFMIGQTPFAGPSPWQTYVSETVFFLTGGLAATLILRWATLFPEEVARGKRIAPACAWLAAPLWYAGRLSLFLGGPLPPRVLPAEIFSSEGLIGVAFLAALTWNYGRADPIGRRRIKWVLLGAYVTTVCLAVNAAVFLLPESRWIVKTYWLGALAFPVFPLAMLIAIVRYNLFDIDRLLSATLSYNAVLVILVGVGLGVVPGVSKATAAAVGLHPSAGQIVLSLLLAAVVVPAQRRLRPQIDRIFFAERYRLEQGLEELMVELAQGEDPRALVQLLGERVDALLRPKVTLVYTRSESSFVPAFVQGRAAPPVYEADDPLIAALRRHKAPLATEHLPARRGAGGVSAFDRVALETLDVPLVVPLRGGAGFVGFLCLGPKRSGDVYTSTDRTLLAAVADKVSGQIARFAAGPGRARRAALSPHGEDALPSSAADARMATILFTDMVGSTELLARLGDERARHVFETHHRLLAEAIASSRGVELEWLGDGMMAAFASASDAVRCAIAMQQAAAEPVEGEPARIRVGLNSGEILARATGEGYFGIPVVTARRLCDLAQAGQILCSQTVAGLLAGRQAFRFRDLGPRELKGVAAPVGVFEVLY